MQQKKCQEKLRNKARGCGARKAKPSKRGDCREGSTRQRQNNVEREAKKEMTRKRRGISLGFALC